MKNKSASFSDGLKTFFSTANVTEAIIVCGIAGSFCTTWLGLYPLCGHIFVAATFVALLIQGGLYCIAKLLFESVEKKRRRTTALLTGFLLCLTVSVATSSLGAFELLKSDVRVQYKREDLQSRWSSSLDKLSEYKRRAQSRLEEDSALIARLYKQEKAKKPEHISTTRVIKLEESKRVADAAFASLDALSVQKILPDDNDKIESLINATSEKLSAADAKMKAFAKAMSTIARDQPEWTAELPNFSNAAGETAASTIDDRALFWTALVKRQASAWWAFIFALVLDLFPVFLRVGASGKKNVPEKIVAARSYLLELQDSFSQSLRDENIEVVATVGGFPNLSVSLHINTAKGGPRVNFTRDFREIASKVRETGGSDFELRGVRTQEGARVREGELWLRELGDERVIFLDFERNEFFDGDVVFS